MDRYMEAIISEERLLSSLADKRNILIASNNSKKNLIEQCEKKEKQLTDEQNENIKRKTFIENKNNLIRKFLKESLIFGIKTSIGFFFIVGLMKWIGTYVNGEIIQANIAEILMGNLIISTILSGVEYYNVSATFRTFTSGYQGNVETDIEDTLDKILEVQTRKIKLQNEIVENKGLLSEIDEEILAINEKILGYRTSRNDLIESLIADLDVHIRDFEYQVSDIQKILEKQIH